MTAECHRVPPIATDCHRLRRVALGGRYTPGDVFNEAALLEDTYLAASRPEGKVSGSSYRVGIAVGKGEHAGCSVVTVDGPDAGDLLGAITTTLSKSACTVKSFGGETLSSGEVRDRLVTCILYLF